MIEYSPLIALGLFTAFWLVDKSGGALLHEDVKVLELKPTTNSIMSTGEGFIPVKYPCRLLVGNANGKGWINVSQEIYDHIKIGDTLTVDGIQGLLTGRWYLQEGYVGTVDAKSRRWVQNSSDTGT